MAFTLRASTPNSAAWTTGTTFTCATGAAVSVGDLLVAAVLCRGSSATVTTSGITDTSSPANTWAELTTIGAGPAATEFSVWYCLAAQQAATPTLTMTLGGGTVAGAYAGIAAFNPGGGTVAVDVTVTNSGLLGSAGLSVPIDTSPTGGSPLYANSLALWAIGIAFTTTNITPAVGDTTLTGEITNADFARSYATYAFTPGNASFTYSATRTAANNYTVYGAGMFTGKAGSTMVFENTFTQGSATLNGTASDALNSTWTITL